MLATRRHEGDPTRATTVKWLKRFAFGGILLLAGLGVLAVVEAARVSEVDQSSQPKPGTSTVNDSGTVSLHYAETADPAHQEIKAILESWRGFDEAAAHIDSTFLIPRNLPIVFTDCGEPNASYDPAQTAIFMCYDLVHDLASDYESYGLSDTAHAAAVWQTTFFIFFHELGHALIDVLDLPVTGREEDAVDQLATLILSETGEEGRDAALLGASWFERTSQRTGSDIPFWAEHSLNSQRYFNILCWVYGSDTTAHEALLGPDWMLPPKRAERCPAEYDRMSRAWESMLAPHAQ